MLDRKVLLVPLFLAAQAAAVHWAGSGEIRPAAPDMAKMPSQIGGWTRISMNSTDVTQQVLHADRLLDWDFLKTGAATDSANLFVGWFQSLRSGVVQPHSPQICLPGNGWTMESTTRAAVATPDGPVPATRIAISKGMQRAMVLYWYQMPRRAVAGEWESKLWLAADLFHEKRTDLALVRVVVMGQTADRERMRVAEEFTAAAYPVVRAWLPR